MDEYFRVKKITDLDDIKEDTIFPTSDFATLTPKGKFVQLEYVEGQEKVEPYLVKPGIWSIQKTMQGLKLFPTSFITDEILENFTHTKDITNKIDCFFNRLHVYAKRKIEIPIRRMLLYGPAGCHAKGTKILMYDGSIKNVENVNVGDELMGPDSQPRKILQLAHGREKMLKVKPTNGEEFIVNYNHIFHLTPSYSNETIKCPINIKGSDLIENTTKPFRERFKLTKTGVNFTDKQLPIPPYILGTWLGDGTSSAPNITSMDNEIVDEWRNYGKEVGLDLKFVEKKSKATTYSLTTGNISNSGKKGRNVFRTHLQELELINNKHIPQFYLTSSREQRLELLAGLIDTDGSLSSQCTFDYVTVNEKLANDMIYLCRSLGFAAYKNLTEKYCYYKGEKVTGNYYRISVSGDLDQVPVKLERKKASPRKQIKDVLRTGFELEILPEDDYYGFALDKDHLYLTADFTIHHNTGKTSSISVAARKYAAEGKTAIILWHTDKFESYQVKDFIKGFEYEGVDKLILIVEDIGGVEQKEVTRVSDSSLLSLLDNQEKTFKIPTMIIATTNHPETFLGNLTNRPGRFSDKIEVTWPNSKARQELLKFFSQGEEISPELNDLIGDNKCREFTVDHLKEIFLRSDLYGNTPFEVTKELIVEIEKYNKGFENRNTRMGF